MALLVGAQIVHRQLINARLMTQPLAQLKKANGALTLLARAAGAILPAAVPSMILPLVLPKDVNGAPAHMAVAGVPLLPRKPAPLPLKHCQRQCLTGPIRRRIVKNIWANGVQALAVTAIVRAHAIWLI